MGKASSAKKVARAARAGGSRRPGQRRALGFPLILTAVCVLGVSLVLFARNSRDASAAPVSQAHDDSDHWHAAYGISQCGEFIFNDEATRIQDAGEDALGIHTHGDGVIHIHPFVDSAGGRNARMKLFFQDIAMTASDSKVEFPDGTVWDESSSTCTVDGAEKPAQIVIAKWNDAQDAADGDKPNTVFTDDFGDIRFQDDREYYTIALVPEGEFEDIPVRPDVVSDLGSLTDVPGATTTTVAGETTSTTVAGETSTTAAGETTSTTAPPETTTTTAGG